MSFIVHKPVDIVDKRAISTYKRIIIVEKLVDSFIFMCKNWTLCVQELDTQCAKIGRITEIRKDI